MGTKYVGTKKEIQALDAFIKLKRASESISSRLNQSVAHFHITESQLGVLEALYHLGSMCQKEIGSKILKSTGNITLILDNLEKRNLVKRTRGKEDKRFISVSLTKEGTNLVKEFLPGHVQAITEEMSVLSSQELEDLARLCKKLGVRE